jgi:hypothetical protein
MTPSPFTELQQIQEAQREGCVPEHKPAVATPRTDKLEYDQECNFDVPWEDECRKMEVEITELNHRLIDRQKSVQAQLIRIEDGWREKLRESQAQIVALRDAGQLSEITSLHHLLDEAGVELAKANAELERLRWRSVEVKPTTEDADWKGPFCPPPAPTAEEVSRAKFNTWYDARCKDPSKHKTALREAMFDSWQAARASKEEKA